MLMEERFGIKIPVSETDDELDEKAPPAKRKKGEPGH